MPFRKRYQQTGPSTVTKELGEGPSTVKVLVDVGVTKTCVSYFPGPDGAHWGKAVVEPGETFVYELPVELLED